MSSSYTFPDGYAVQIIPYEKAIELFEDGEVIYYITEDGQAAYCESTYLFQKAHKNGLKFFTE